MQVRVNGYLLKNTIQAKMYQRDVLAAQFNDSLKFFPGEKKPNPVELMGLYVTCEQDIAKLQLLQSQYNMAVKVVFEGESVPLMYLVKLIGGLGRQEKMWRTSVSKGNDSRYYDRDERSKDSLYATHQLSVEDTLELSKLAAKRCSAAREAIAVGNAQGVDLDLDPGLLE